MVDVFVGKDPIQNPYREFTYVIPASGQQEILYAHSYFRIMSLSAAGSVAVRWGQSGSQSSVIGSGIGIELPEAVDRVTLINLGGADVTITVALSMGRVSDDRLNVSGTLSTSVISPTTAVDTADVAVLTLATTLVAATNANTQQVIISNLAANGTSIRVGTVSAGAARGVEIQSGATIVLDCSANIYVYNPSAATINIGVLFLRT